MLERYRAWAPRSISPALALGAFAFLVLFREPMFTLARDWWTDADSAHGLLLFPLAVYLAWRTGLVPESRPLRLAGTAVLVAAILLRYASGLAAELFTMRASLIGASIGLLLFYRGWAQIRAWWLPLSLVCLSVPIPDVVLNSLALPLQLKASAIGASLLKSRGVPVLLDGNILRLPDRMLFVTEACSGLRSLTALLALGILLGGLWLRSLWGRAALLVVAVPVAMAVNSLRVFLTGFLVFYVDPRLADGFTHYTEGWVLFGVAFMVLGAMVWALRSLEQFLSSRAGEPAETRMVPNPPVRPISSPRPGLRWVPATVLAAGVLLILGIGASRPRSLQRPLGDVISRELQGLVGRDVTIPEDERVAAGVTNYLLRYYTSAAAGSPGLSVYVGYYESQTQGQTIHSPKNCLPGAGWEALQATTTTIQTAGGGATVNRYLIQKGQEQAMVLYWYQGRGRLQSNEYAVKWNLLLDAALRRRSEEALVRIVVPVNGEPDATLARARASAERVASDLERALPI